MALRPLAGVRPRRPFVGSAPPAAVAAVTRRVRGIVYGLQRAAPTWAPRPVVLRILPRTSTQPTRPIPRIVLDRQSLPAFLGRAVLLPAPKRTATATRPIPRIILGKIPPSIPQAGRAIVLGVPRRLLPLPSKLPRRIIFGRLPITIPVLGRAILRRVFQPPRNYKTPRPRLVVWRGLLPLPGTGRVFRVVLPPPRPTTTILNVPAIAGCLSINKPARGLLGANAAAPGALSINTGPDGNIFLYPKPDLSTVTTIAANGDFTPAVSGSYRVEVLGSGSDDNGGGGGGGGYTAGTFSLVAGTPYACIFAASYVVFDPDSIDSLCGGIDDGTGGAGGTPGDNNGTDQVGFTGGSGDGAAHGGTAASPTGNGIDGAAPTSGGAPGDGGTSDGRGKIGYIRITGPL